MDVVRVSKGRIGLYVVLAVAMLMGLLFLPAGRIDWWQGWAYFGLVGVTSIVVALLVAKRNPELGHRRLQFGEGTKAWDRVILGLIKVTFCGAIVVGAFDAGRHGPDLPGWLWPIGAALFLVGDWILTASMLENTHFEATVRVQTDRDQQVIDTGPYAVVRHPGYAGGLLLMAATPFLLGSSWTCAPIAAGFLVFMVRILLEERLLRRELEGYEEYTKRVRYRLVPGIW